MFGSKEARSYEIHGVHLKCQVCTHDEFQKREAQLNTSLASMFNLDWANASALCFVCEKCGYIHWFLPK